MTIKGDLVATLVSKGKSREEATALVTAILDCANEPDFAIRYARENCPRASSSDKLMNEYWRVITFLKSTV